MDIHESRCTRPTTQVFVAAAHGQVCIAVAQGYAHGPGGVRQVPQTHGTSSANVLVEFSHVQTCAAAVVDVRQSHHRHIARCQGCWQVGHVVDEAQFGQMVMGNALGHITVGGEHMAFQHDDPARGCDAERIVQQLVLIDTGGVCDAHILCACPDEVCNGSAELSGLFQPVEFVPTASACLGPALLQHRLHPQWHRARHRPDGVGIEIKRSRRAGVKAIPDLGQICLVLGMGIPLNAIGEGQWQTALQDVE